MGDLLRCVLSFVNLCTVVLKPYHSIQTQFPGWWNLWFHIFNTEGIHYYCIALYKRSILFSPINRILILVDDIWKRTHNPVLNNLRFPSVQWYRKWNSAFWNIWNTEKSEFEQKINFQGSIVYHHAVGPAFNSASDRPRMLISRLSSPTGLALSNHMNRPLYNTHSTKLFILNLGTIRFMYVGYFRFLWDISG